MRITFYTIFSLAFLASASSAVGHVLLKYPSGDETFSTGDTIKIEWQVAIDHGDCNWDLYFSTDGGSSWSEIAIDLSKSNFGYEWIIPAKKTGEIHYSLNPGLRIQSKYCLQLLLSLTHSCNSCLLYH